VSVKIRLKRIGKLRAPHYRIVVADSKTHRDGRVIEEIGRYVPTTEPSIIEINSERAQYWLSVGAQPTEAAAVLLRLSGDLANEKGEKKNSIKPQAKKDTFSADEKKKSVILPKEEKKAPVQEPAPAEEAPAAEAPAAEEAVVEEAVVAEAATEAPAEVSEETPAAEAPAEEAPAAEVAEEAPAAEEAPVAEAAEEAPAAEEAAEEPKSE
jgi:small subunit ribosomal protein S16